MTISLSPQIEAIIRDKIDSGRYADAGEVIREALRLLEERDRDHRLRAELAIGLAQLDRGETVPYTSDLMERLKREATEHVRAGKPIKDAVKP